MAEEVPEAGLRLIIEVGLVVGVLPGRLRNSLENSGHSRLAIEDQKGRLGVPPACIAQQLVECLAEAGRTRPELALGDEDVLRN